MPAARGPCSLAAAVLAPSHPPRTSPSPLLASRPTAHRSLSSSITAGRSDFSGAAALACGVTTLDATHELAETYCADRGTHHRRGRPGRWDRARARSRRHLGPLPVTRAARTHRPGGQTSPEELAASGYSSCFAMASALRLDNQHTSPRLLVITAIVALDHVETTLTIMSCALQVRVQTPGLAPAEFKAILAEVAALCLVSELVDGAEIPGRRRTRHLVSGCTRQSHGRRCSCPTL
ncbi:OsmC family protein [Nocardia sp. NPDC050193]